jgi:hypothetical protein
MKKNLPVLFSILMVCSMITTTSCHRKKGEVKAYVETINQVHQQVIDRFDELDNTLERYHPDSMDLALLKAQLRLDSAEVAVNGLEAVNPESDLKSDALLLFSTYRMILNDNYADMILHLKKPAGTFRPADQFYVNNLGELIYRRRQKAKERYELEAAKVLATFDIPFKPVMASDPSN